jgi:hypothetical protein
VAVEDCADFGEEVGLDELEVIAVVDPVGFEADVVAVEEPESGLPSSMSLMRSRFSASVSS